MSITTDKASYLPGETIEITITPNSSPAEIPTSVWLEDIPLTLANETGLYAECTAPAESLFRFGNSFETVRWNTNLTLRLEFPTDASAEATIQIDPEEVAYSKEFYSANSGTSDPDSLHETGTAAGDDIRWVVTQGAVTFDTDGVPTATVLPASADRTWYDVSVGIWSAKDTITFPAVTVPAETPTPTRLAIPFVNSTNPIEVTRQSVQVLANSSETSRRRVDDKIVEIELSVVDTGATRDGSTDDTARIDAAVSEAVANGIQKIVFPEGTYMVSQLNYTLTANLDFVLREGAVIKGAAGSNPVISINGGAGRYAFRLTGGKIDCSLRTFGSGQTGTAIELVDCDDWRIACCHMYAQDDWIGSGSPLVKYGDSGITTVECERGSVMGCVFEGWPDAGIYLSGGASTGSSDDYGETRVYDNTFLKCAVGFTSKRRAARSIVSMNNFIDCRVGVTMLDAVSGATQLQPGRETIIASNTFVRTESRCVELRHSPGCVVVGNTATDVGRDRDGSAVTGRFLWLNGTTQCVVSGNVARMSEWTTHSGVRFVESTDVTIDVTTYDGGYNQVSGNLSDGLYGFVVETASDPSVFTANQVVNVTTVINGLNTLSICNFQDGAGQDRTFVGTTEMARVNANSAFVRNLRFLNTVSAASVPGNFSADRYVAVVDDGGTTRYLPLANATW